MRLRSMKQPAHRHGAIRRGSGVTLLAALALIPLFVAMVPVHAAGPALRSVSTSTASGAAFTVAAPAGESSGDVLIAALQGNGPGAVTAPSGWTLIGSASAGGDVTVTYYKVAGSSEPSSYSWSSSVSMSGSIAILDYTGIDPTAPLNAWAGNSGSGTAVAPAVATTTSTVSVILVSWVGPVAQLSANSPSGYSQRWFLNSTQTGSLLTGNIFIATYGADALSPAAAGTLPAHAVTALPGDLTSSFTAQQIALAVAGPAPTPTPTPTPSPTPTPTPTPPSPNAIQTENQNAGDPNWYGFTAKADASGNPDQTTMNGYGSKISVNNGDSIDFYVTTTATSYTAEVYRLGWYAGAGARHMASLGTFSGVNQPKATPDPNLGQVVENWAKSMTLNVPASWTTGVYVVKLTSSAGNSNFILFIVRNDGGHEKYVDKISTNTYQAYNTYGGTSLYNNNTDKSIYPYPHAMKVSYDRPFITGDGEGFFLWQEYAMVRWLEKNGYDVSYITDVDLDQGNNPLTNHKAIFSVGHDEYWSLGERTNVENAINAGVNAGFFSGNVMYWQVRYEPNTAGVPDRLMVGYKDFAYCPGFACPPGPDPMVGVNNAVVTTNWRADPVDRPENAVMGEMSDGGQVGPNANYIVKNASNWVYAGTGFTEGQAIPGIVGYEYDKVHDNGLTPAGFTKLSESPVTNIAGGSSTPDVANSGLYTAPGGARVFAAGTISWDQGLDDWNGNHLVNAGIQQATANILANFAP